MLTFEEIGSHIIPGPGQDVNHDNAFKFIDHVDSMDGVAYPAYQNLIYTDVPLPYLIPYLSLKMGLKIAALHNINLDPHAPESKLNSSFLDHSCVSCNLYWSVFSVVTSKIAKDRDHKHVIKVKNMMSLVNESNQAHTRQEDLGKNGQFLDSIH